MQRSCKTSESPQINGIGQESCRSENPNESDDLVHCIPSKGVLVGKSFMSQWHVRTTMRKDQIFVLMLVILLPMTGCFNDIVGDTIAEGDVTDSTSNNDFEDVIRTVHIEPGDVVNITLDGNTTLELLSGHRFVTHEGNQDTFWSNTRNVYYDMHCEGVEFPVNKFTFSDSPYAANLPDTTCHIELDTGNNGSPDYEFHYILTFREVPLASL